MSSETDPVTTLADLRWNQQGLIPVVVQDNSTGEVLMMAWANEEALQYTLETRKATYWSWSRSELWTKGLTSGHVQHVVAVFHDCDADTILYVVEQTGAACHTNTKTCFTARPLLTPDSQHPLRNDLRYGTSIEASSEH